MRIIDNSSHLWGDDIKEALPIASDRFFRSIETSSRALS